MNVQNSDISFLIAAFQNTMGTVEVDGQRLAQQLGLSLSTIPPKFSQIRKRYNLNVKVMNTGAIRRSGNGARDAVQPAYSEFGVEEGDGFVDALSTSGCC